MTAEIIRLETSAERLYHEWHQARLVHMAHPTPENLERCVRTMRAFWLRQFGRQGLDPMLQRERHYCGIIISTQSIMQGLPHGRR